LSDVSEKPVTTIFRVEASQARHLHEEGRKQNLMHPTYSSETSVDVQQNAQLCIPTDRKLHNYLYENLRSAHQQMFKELL
jgi:hypothetical protein